MVSYYPPEDCPCCGGKVLAHDKPYRTHQVFDLPEVSYFVTEHQLFRAISSQCINTTVVTLPETVCDTQMGPNFLSYIALQSGQFHQSVTQIQQQLKQHFGLVFSRGAISEAQGRVSAILTPTHQAIKHQVQSASLIHADETRHQRGGERRWMWMALSKIAVCFMTAYGRGIDAAKRLLGSELAGVLVTDQYAGYRFVGASQRQLCWAHVLRNVVAIAQSGEQLNQSVGAWLVLLANNVFRVRQRILSLVETAKRLGRCPQEWLRAIVKACIEKTDYPIPAELCASSPCR